MREFTWETRKCKPVEDGDGVIGPVLPFDDVLGDDSIRIYHYNNPPGLTMVVRIDEVISNVPHPSS